MPLLLGRSSLFWACGYDKRANLECKKCELILVEAVQTDCGYRFCKECAKNSSLCQCLETGHYRSDKAAQREVKDLPTRCCLNDCPWQGRFADLAGHLTTCPAGEGVQWLCLDCGGTFYLLEMEGHLRECRRFRPAEYTAGVQALIARVDPPEHTSAVVQTLENNVAPQDTRHDTVKDGTKIWNIPQFSQRMEDARTGKYTRHISAPFYSGSHGYKMCLRLYILGDGIGKGTHMSLFFVVMKGEFDAILQWPFTHKVSFRLINKCRDRDIVEVFQPDPLSSSFHKPKTDMNVASGYPRFVSLTELNNGGFIIDDTIFIKVKVDTSTIQHP